MYLEDINQNKLVVKDFKIYKASNEIWVSIVKNNITTISISIKNQELKGLNVNVLDIKDVYKILARKLNGFSVKEDSPNKMQKIESIIEDIKEDAEKEVTNFGDDFMKDVIKEDKYEKKNKKKRRGEDDGDKD